jgi:hypothetical protein
MGEDLCECCVCGGCTSDYRRVKSCHCGASFCCKDCVKNGAITVSDDDNDALFTSDSEEEGDGTYCLECVCDAYHRKLGNLVKQDSKANASAKLACKNLLKRLRRKLSLLSVEIETYENFWEFLDSSFSTYEEFAELR